MPFSPQCKSDIEYYVSQQVSCLSITLQNEKLVRHVLMALPNSRVFKKKANKKEYLKIQEVIESLRELFAAETRTLLPSNVLEWKRLARDQADLDWAGAAYITDETTDDNEDKKKKRKLIPAFKPVSRPDPTAPTATLQEQLLEVNEEFNRVVSSRLAYEAERIKVLVSDPAAFAVYLTEREAFQKIATSNQAEFARVQASRPSINPLLKELMLQGLLPDVPLEELRMLKFEVLDRVDRQGRKILEVLNVALLEDRLENFYIREYVHRGLLAPQHVASLQMTPLHLNILTTENIYQLITHEPSLLTVKMALKFQKDHLKAISDPDIYNLIKMTPQRLSIRTLCALQSRTDFLKMPNIYRAVQDGFLLAEQLLTMSSLQAQQYGATAEEQWAIQTESAARMQQIIQLHKRRSWPATQREQADRADRESDSSTAVAAPVITTARYSRGGSTSPTAATARRSVSPTGSDGSGVDSLPPINQKRMTNQ